MPIFSFTCSECGKKEDLIVKSSEVLEVSCECDKMATMLKDEQVHQLNFALKGKWFKNTKGY